MSVDTGSDLSGSRKDCDFGHTRGMTGGELKLGKREQLESIVAFTFLYTVKSSKRASLT